MSHGLYPKTPPPQLEVSSDWAEGASNGILTIASGGIHPQILDESQKVLEPMQEGDHWIAAVPQGKYTVTVEANSSDAQCKAATCSAQVEVKPPRTVEIVTPHEIGRPCCVSLWMLRTFGLYAEAQGTRETDGSFKTASDEIGKLQLEFNQGRGFGVELERLLGGGVKDKGTGWGWTFGLSLTDFDTFWVFDSGQHWLMDHDRVPMLSLTSGPRYHWGGPKLRLFGGPVLAYVRFDDGSYADGTKMPGTFEAEFDDGFAFGADLGADLLIGKCWGLTVGLQYLKVSTETGALELDVDPLSVRTGLVYRF